MNAISTIVLANNREFCHPLDSFMLPDEITLWRNEDIDLADMGLFWCGDDKLVITPEPLEAQFVSDVCAAMGYRNVHVLSPAVRSDAMCDDIQSDPAMFALLVDTIRNSENPQIISWGATLPLYRLVERLRGLGLTFQTPELPAREDYWTSVYFDSKAGFRELCQRLGADHPEIKIPEGFLCSHREDALEVASYFTRQGRDFILKASRGVGGWGTHRVLCTPTIGADQTVQHVRDLLESSGIWQSGPLIIEAYIEPCTELDGGSPTIEGRIGLDGTGEVFGWGKQILSSGLAYTGVRMGEGVYSAEVSQRLRYIGTLIGDKIAQYGYRGWFDVDTVIANDGEIYCVELNARRTGVAHIIDIRSFLAEQGQDCLVAETHELIDVNVPVRYDWLRARLEETRSILVESRCQLILTMATSLVRDGPYLGYLLLGHDWQAVEMAKVDFRRRLL